MYFVHSTIFEKWGSPSGLCRFQGKIAVPRELPDPTTVRMRSQEARAPWRASLNSRRLPTSRGLRARVCRCASWLDPAVPSRCSTGGTEDVADDIRLATRRGDGSISSDSSKPPAAWKRNVASQIVRRLPCIQPKRIYQESGVLDCPCISCTCALSMVLRNLCFKHGSPYHFVLRLSD